MTKLPERNLNVLRASAVMAVLVDHLANAANHSMALLGRVGVLMFFVHTACVLMASLERNPSTFAFYVRRAFRIYPLAIAVVLVASALPNVGRNAADRASECGDGATLATGAVEHGPGAKSDGQS